jgi:NDP-sugar pyrophosphorylase family protein
MKNKKGIIILIVISVLGVAGFYIYDYIKRKIAEKKERELFSAAEEADAQMRDKFVDIKSPDDFIQAVKYTRYKSPWGYDVSNLESKKAIIEKYSLSELNKFKNIIYEGISKRNEKESFELLWFLQKFAKV